MTFVQVRAGTSLGNGGSTEVVNDRCIHVKARQKPFYTSPDQPTLTISYFIFTLLQVAQMTVTKAAMINMAATMTGALEVLANANFVAAVTVQGAVTANNIQISGTTRVTVALSAGQVEAAEVRYGTVAVGDLFSQVIVTGRSKISFFDSAFMEAATLAAGTG